MNTGTTKKTRAAMGKIDGWKLKLGDRNVDLDEIPDNIDINVQLPEKKAPTATKTALKPKNTVALF